MNCLLAMQKCPIRNEYSIHGLWFDHNRKHSCAFSTEQLPDDLLQRLKEVWYSCPSISHHGSPAFWKHEYCKHGKPYFPTAESYFRTALRAYDYVKPTIHLYTDHEIKIPLVYHGPSFTYQHQLKM